jgi:hypothetical protein
MLRNQQAEGRYQLSVVSLDELIPKLIPPIFVHYDIIISVKSCKSTRF